MDQETKNMYNRLLGVYEQKYGNVGIGGSGGFQDALQSRFSSGRYDPALYKAFQKDWQAENEYDKPVAYYADQVVDKNARKWLDNAYDQWVEQQKSVQSALGGGGGAAKPATPTSNLSPFMGGTGPNGNQATLANQLSYFYGAPPKTYFNQMNDTYGVNNSPKGLFSQPYPQQRPVPPEAGQFMQPMQRNQPMSGLDPNIGGLLMKRGM